MLPSAVPTMTAATYPNHRYMPSLATAEPAAQLVDDSSQFQRLGFNILLVFLFLAFSRIFDVKFGGLHITGISFRLMLIMVLLSRGFFTAVKGSIGKAMLGFTIWMAACVPFSVWKGGSKDLFVSSWLGFSFVIFLAVAGLTINYKQWTKLMSIMTWALFAFVVIVNIWGMNKNGRLFLEQGKFANPNEMAQALLLGLPLWGSRMAITKSGLQKVFGLGVMLLMLATTFRTGSRGAMIAFLAMLLVAFLRGSVVDKMKLVMASVLFLGFIVTVMPGKLVSRYKTAVNEEDAEVDPDADLASALSSTQSRKELLKHSLILTLHNPLFGVGPGMFTVADDAYVKSIGGRKGVWLGTHNSYTQVSSEMGIPGFLFFAASIWFSLTSTNRIFRRTRGDPRLEDMGTAAMGLHYALIIYAVTVLFEHIAYTIMLPVFAGLAAALVRTAEAEIVRLQSAPAPVTMSTAMFHSYLASRPREHQSV